MNRTDPTCPSAREAPDPEVERALDVFRRDCRVASPSARLAERVLAAVARGDDETRRFHRVARAYAAAAAVLAALGTGGALLVRHGAADAAVPSAGRSSLAEVEEAGLLREDLSLLDGKLGATLGGGPR